MAKQKDKIKPTKTAVEKIKPTDNEQWFPFGGGCYLVVAKKGKNGKASKRFVGRTTIGNPSNNSYPVPLGVWGKDIDNPQDALNKWNEMKSWGKQNNRDLRTYFDYQETVKSKILLTEVISEYLEEKQKTLKPNAFITCRNRLNQIQSLLNGNELVTDFVGTNGRGYIKRKVLDPKIASGVGYTAIRFRRLLNNVFDFACWDKGYLEPEQMPARLDKQFDFEKKIKKPEMHPHLSWTDFCTELIPKLSTNECNSGRLNNLATKASLLTLTRVSSVVSWKWSWFSQDDNCWIIPADTTGLKRRREDTIDEKFNHYIPNTPLLETLMNNLYSINGNKEYVFHSPYQGNNPYLSAQSPNDHLIQLGFQGRQDAHGFRHVASTLLCEEFDELLVGKCLGHRNQQGVMKHYNDAKYISQKRVIMERWHEALIENGLRI